MEIKRPNQERFNMQHDENMAFWRLILMEYSLRYIRECSLSLVQNNPMVRNEDA